MMGVEPALNRRNRKLQALALLLLALAAAGITLAPEMYLLVIFHLTAIPTIAYPLVYMRSPWKSGPTGKALMNMARALALVFSLRVLSFWWPFPGFAYIYSVAITYLGVAITYQFVVMLRLRRLANRVHPDVRRTLLPSERNH